VTVEPSSTGWQQRDDDPDELLGSKDKYWITGSDGHPWLLKYARVSGGQASGEHWAECVVHGLASLVGVPTPCVYPALDEERRAVLSRSVLREGETRLEHGSELLRQTVPDYNVAISQNNPEYTVSNVRLALNGVYGPRGVTASMDAFTAWAGYVLLDAWVSGCDRHHDNWAAATNDTGDKRLVESFDHGNALGFQVSEKQLNRLSEPSAIARWLDHGRTHFACRPTPVAVALEALSMLTAHDRAYWINRLVDVRQSDVEAIINAVPLDYMTVRRCRFVLAMLEINRERICDALV
jgi:hypothetical protein